MSANGFSNFFAKSYNGLQIVKGKLSKKYLIDKNTWGGNGDTEFYRRPQGSKYIIIAEVIEL